MGDRRHNPRLKLAGQRFGKLVVIRYDTDTKWICRCDCGRLKSIKGYSLTSGATKSCARCPNPRRDLTGQRFGELVAIKPTDSAYSPNRLTLRWLFRCDCGNEKIIRWGSVVYGGTKSCGHGRSKVRDANPSDFIGKRFGTRTVIGVADAQASNGARRLNVKCDCGNISVVRLARLLKGESITCRGCSPRRMGHTAPNAVDITGQRFGMLVAVKRSELRGGKQLYWIFRCDCGAEKSIFKGNVVSGKQKSCGCQLTKWQKSDRCRENFREAGKRSIAKLRSRLKYILRIAALKTGDVIYEGPPCVRCGSVFRYTKGHGACIRCHAEGRIRRWPEHYKRNWESIRSSANRRARAVTDLLQLIKRVNPQLLEDLGLLSIESEKRGIQRRRDRSSKRHYRLRELVHVVASVRPQILDELGITTKKGRMENDTSISA